MSKPYSVKTQEEWHNKLWQSANNFYRERNIILPSLNDLLTQNPNLALIAKLSVLLKI